MHMVDSKYSLKLKNTLKPENKCIDAKKCQFLFVMQYWRMNCGTLKSTKRKILVMLFFKINLKSKMKSLLSYPLMWA